MKSEWKSFLSDAGGEFADDRVRHFGNPAREARAALGGTVFADLGMMGVIAVYGEDAAGFLQSQLSNDIEAVSAQQSQLSAFCTPKGRMVGLMRIFRVGDTWYLRLPTDTLETVLQRLRMFVLRARVTLEDVSENFIRIGIAGEDAAAYLESAAGALPNEVNGTYAHDDTTVIRVPGVQPRYEVYVSSLEAACQLWDSLNVQAAPVGESSWRLLEILAGIPNIYAATGEQFIPQMLNLTSLNGLSFTKGCYPGQEIVARTRYLGKLKRRMYLCNIGQDEPVLPGMAVIAGEDSSQAIGQIVDAQPDPDGGQVGLAVLRIDSAEAGNLQIDGTEDATLQLRELPYPVTESEENSS